MISKIRSTLLIIYLFILAALVLDLGNPLFGKPARDGGFFLYAGSQILNGKIPYLDFWDSKGPTIFYINALGLLLGGGSRWGVWILELVCIFGTLLIMWRALSRRWGLGASLFGVTMGGFGLQVVLGYGNYTEEYALLFNAAGLYIFLSMVDTEKNYWKYFWIGALFGLSFTFRANNIGGLLGVLTAVFLFYMFKRDFIEAIKIYLVTLAGFALPLLAWILYFMLLDGAGEMIYASIIFNISYSAAKDRAWFDLFGGFGRYGMSWYGWFTLSAWFILVIRLLFNIVQRKPLSLFEIYLLFWFPIEIFLSNLSGRNFTHYYISWSLAVAVYCAYVFAEFWEFTFKVSSLDGWSGWSGEIVAALLMLVLFATSSTSRVRYMETLDRLFLNRTGTMEYTDPISSYIQENTHSFDLVLTWYPEAGISFMTGRMSPVKYLYYPLFLEGSLTDEIESTYIAGLTANRPELILDCSRGVDAIPSLDPATREEQYSTPGIKRKMYIHPGMEQIFFFVSENYRIETTLEDCIIFRLNTP